MEIQYLQLLHNLIQHGEKRNTRNGVTRSLFGEIIQFDLNEGFPLLTTKKVFFKGIVTELSWFLRGSTDVTELHKHNNHIWDGNTKDNHFDAGPVYGFQWRHFGAKYINCKHRYTGKGIDQVQHVIDLIKSDPTSRRIVMNAWNPSQQNQMCLPPCHVMYQFYVKNGRLNCQMYQRSSDAFLGLPFNIASTALLVHLIAHETGLIPNKMRMVLGDVHLYESHLSVAKKQIDRPPLGFPTIRIEREKDGLWDVQFEQIHLENYKHHAPLRAEMNV